MQDALQAKTLKDVVISQDDIRNLRDFFTHFKVEVCPELEDVLKRWESKEKNALTPQDQEDLRVAICVNMMKSNHKMFKDELFAPILKNSEKIVFDATFKSELEDQLSKEKKDGSEQGNPG